MTAAAPCRCCLTKPNVLAACHDAVSVEMVGISIERGNSRGIWREMMAGMMAVFLTIYSWHKARMEVLVSEQKRNGRALELHLYVLNCREVTRHVIVLVMK